jgi:hypothetical protein
VQDRFGVLQVLHDLTGWVIEGVLRVDFEVVNTVKMAINGEYLAAAKPFLHKYRISIHRLQSIYFLHEEVSEDKLVLGGIVFDKGFRSNQLMSSSPGFFVINLPKAVDIPQIFGDNLTEIFPVTEPLSQKSCCMILCKASK